MNVKATPGTQCPMEGRPRTYIGDAETVTVPDSAYYRRLLDDGSLVLDKADIADAAERKGGKK